MCPICGHQLISCDCEWGEYISDDYLLENDIAPKVQVLLEHHTDLAKNVLVAKGIEERVGMLEFEVKAIKAVMSKSA